MFNIANKDISMYALAPTIDIYANNAICGPHVYV
jgi:hypothetical protein